MEGGKEGEGGEERAEYPALNWKEKIQKEWNRVREHAETYPYVWASYIVVYGGFGVYLTYRWRKLRRTEARVRVLQEQLRQLAENEDAASFSVSGGASEKPSSAKPVPRPTKAEEKLK